MYRGMLFGMWMVVAGLAIGWWSDSRRIEDGVAKLRDDREALSSEYEERIRRLNEDNQRWRRAQLIPLSQAEALNRP